MRTKEEILESFRATSQKALNRNIMENNGVRRTYSWDEFWGKVNNKIQTRDTMPEIHTTNELYRMAVQDIKDRCQCH